VLKRIAEAGNPECVVEVTWDATDDDGFYSPILTVRRPIRADEVDHILSTVSSLMRRLSLDFPEGPISPEYREVTLMLHELGKRGYNITQKEDE